jgi:ADP-ribose pyrophosphatase
LVGDTVVGEMIGKLRCWSGDEEAMTTKKNFAKSTSKNAAAVKAEQAAAKSTETKANLKASKAAETSSAPKAVKTIQITKQKDPKKSKPLPKPETEKTAKVLDSQVAYEGPLFRVVRDHLVEPGGHESTRDVIRHNGSVVILAVDHGKHGKKHKKDPWIVIERQYRHAAGQYLWELPAGKLDKGEQAIDGAKRELAEETGYKAKDWSPLVEYYASPGFLGESMKIFLAEGLIPGDAHPEEDEKIDFRLVRLSELLEMVDKGKIIDGKTLTSVLLYARMLGIKRKK